jgi:hypothetical protein
LEHQNENKTRQQAVRDEIQSRPLLNHVTGGGRTSNHVQQQISFPLISFPSRNYIRREARNYIRREAKSTMGKKDKSRTQSKEDEEVMGETRFAAAETHPQFRPMKQKESKVVLDERFSSVLTDPRFQLEGRDKYGRKGKKKESAKEELKDFYMVEGEEEEAKKSSQWAKSDDRSDTGSESSSDEDKGKSASDKPDQKSDSKENENEDPASRIAYLTALSRGDFEASSSSDDESDSSQSSDEDDEEEEDPVYGNAGVLDPSSKTEEIEISYDSSPYLVVQNMDWQHIRAVDLFSLISSFTTPGAVKRVQVFQSDFGMERMEKDQLSGPSGIWKKEKNKNTKADTEDEEDSDEEEHDVDNKEDEGSTSGADDSDMEDQEEEKKFKVDTVLDGSDYDPEKLRAYEASKLKYYFAVVEFLTPDHADIAYREVDGMEFEHSSAAIDLRTLPIEAREEVMKDRQMRDEATTVPSNYEPPDFVVSALQQTNIECTWDQGDVERERKLTNYGSAGWQDMNETDDIKAYLASDGSSDDDSDDGRANKSSKMRKMLGLGSDSEGGESDNDDDSSGEDDDSNSDDEEAMSKTIKYVPGNKDLEDKIRSKIMSKDESEEELTPWQKYQEKRKHKQRERRQAARGRKRGGDDKGKGDDDGKSDESVQSASDKDDFFVENKTKKGEKASRDESRSEPKESSKSQPANNEELELLLAGDNDEEQERDYDIRGIQRMEKNKGKKLKGSRKRKEDKVAADVSGTGFKVDVRDGRFSAVLDGTDGKFGIDKTDSNYKETSAMRDILAEQTKRRKKKRQKTKATTVAPNVDAESEVKSTGSSALSSLVQRLKSKVSTHGQ